MTTLDRRRLETALALSLAVHLVAAMWLGRAHVRTSAVERPPLVLIPVSLVGTVGGGGGERGPAPVAGAQTPAPPAPTPAAPPVPATPPVLAAPPRVAHEHRAARPVAVHTAAPTPAAPAVASLPDEGGAAGGRSGGAGGGGDGTGGDGSGGARIAYGTNPKPPYPISALRLRIEGTVLLEVTVAPDGRAGAVRVQQSSGNAALDDSALTTVRDRWRFVPARASGVPIEGTVQVPIHFRLVDDRG